MSISTRLDFLANHFGGYQEVVKLLPASDLNIIASFCGPVSVNSIASLINETTTDPIDLLELGYIANSTYYVHNSRYEYLFSGQVDRYFAASAEIKKLALTAPHGSYYYITFTNTDNQPFVVMLWLLRESTAAVKATKLTAIRASATNREHSGVPFSLFVGVAQPQLARSKELVILMAKGDWQQPPTINNLYQDPNLIQVAFAANAGRMLVDIQDVWLAVVEIEPNPVDAGRPIITAVWKPVSNLGIGTERLLPSDRDLLYVAGAGFNRLTFDSQIQQGYEAGRLAATVKFDYSYTI